MGDSRSDHRYETVKVSDKMGNEKPRVIFFIYKLLNAAESTWLFVKLLLSFYRDNEEWKKLHKVLAPKMLRPGDILENLEKLNGIAREAVDHMMTLRGLNGEMPDLEGEIVKCVAECKFI